MKSVFLTLALFCAASAFAQNVEAPKPSQVLFVGNSYLYYNDSLHNHAVRMAREAGGEEAPDYNYRSITISGGSLEHHPIAGYLEPGAVGYAEPFDVVVLQGHSAAALSEKRSESFRKAVAAAAEAAEAHGATLALYMTHAYEEGHKSYAPDNIDRIAALYEEAAQAHGAVLIPVGLAFEEARRRRPELALHKPFDHSHPSLEGSYLAAATVFATLYGASPVGLDYDYYGAVDDETAAFLQEVAADVALGAPAATDG